MRCILCIQINPRPAGAQNCQLNNVAITYTLIVLIRQITSHVQKSMENLLKLTECFRTEDIDEY